MPTVVLTLKILTTELQKASFQIKVKVGFDNSEGSKTRWTSVALPNSFPIKKSKAGCVETTSARYRASSLPVLYTYTPRRFFFLASRCVQVSRQSVMQISFFLFSFFCVVCWSLLLTSPGTNRSGRQCREGRVGCKYEDEWSLYFRPK